MPKSLLHRSVLADSSIHTRSPNAREAGWRDPGHPARTPFGSTDQWRELGTGSHAAEGLRPLQKGDPGVRRDAPAKRLGRGRWFGIRGLGASGSEGSVLRRLGKVTTQGRCGEAASPAPDARPTWGLSSQLAEAGAPRRGAAPVGRRQRVCSRNQPQGLILPTAARRPRTRRDRVRQRWPPRPLAGGRGAAD